MSLFKTRSATLLLIVANAIAFLIIFALAGTLDDPQWTFTLLDTGALFNPFALDTQWYRIFTHMFLHGGILHLLFNMYGLFVAGGDLEELAGPKKLLTVYFISGIGSALASLYVGLFTISVGASGAIFGVFGYNLAVSIILSKREGISLIPIIVNFSIFLLINVLLGEAFHADHAAHFGGLATGGLLALITYLRHRDFVQFKTDFVLVPLFVILYFLLPRYQVQYYKFFQQVLHAEDTYNAFASKRGTTDEQYAKFFTQNNLEWDSANSLLAKIKRLPVDLKSDSSKLVRYIALRKLENEFKLRIINDEVYTLIDSIEAVQDSMTSLVKLDHPLSFKPTTNDREQLHDSLTEVRRPTRVWYDSNWIEIPRPGAYYRIGYRDSIGQWQGPVRDYYANGKLQMKGEYKNDRRNGIFLYYSDHNTYTSAGRYVDSRSYGKWQTFHDNGALESETIYRDRAFLKTMFDSAGNILVKNGEGTVKEYYPDGSVKTEGKYIDGQKQGIWIGRHPNGSIYYMEEYNNGILLRGRSQLLSGETFSYDASSFYPKPEGGYEKLNEYFRDHTAALDNHRGGTVKVSFRVTAEGTITDVEFEQRLSQREDEFARELIFNGPSWFPAKAHGHKAVDGFALVRIDF